MDNKNRIPLSNIKWLFSAAQLNGVDATQILSILEVSPEQFNDALLTVSCNKAITVRNVIKNKNKNPAIALISGEKIPLGEFGILDYICSTSPTVKISYSKLHQYFNILIHPSFKFKYTTNDIQTSCLELILNTNASSQPKWYVQECIEFTFSIMLSRLRLTTGYHAIPKKIYFMHSKPEYIDEYNRIFQSDFVFNASKNLMYFDSGISDLKQIYTEDSKLHEFISGIAETALKKIFTSTDIECKILQILKQEIKNGKPTINIVADKLGISRQTLHRKLTNSSTTFSNLLDNFRKELAQTYLQESSLTIDEISLLLGYSNTSAFHRSYKRITGSSPNTYRK